MSEHNSPTPAPLLTIIMPVYNVARYLDEAIASVTAQTITDWELIIVDDGSTDGSSEICDRHAVSDNRIRVIHQKNSGVSAARNAALEKARGSIVGFIDGDDTIGRVEKPQPREAARIARQMDRPRRSYERAAAQRPHREYALG